MNRPIYVGQHAMIISYKELGLKEHFAVMKNFQEP